MAFPSGITNQYVIPIHQDAAVLKDSHSSLPFQIFEKALLCQKCKNYYNPHPDTAVYFILKKIKTRHPNIKEMMSNNKAFQATVKPTSALC